MTLDMNLRCPLCGSDDVELTERLRSSDIATCYKRVLGRHIGSELCHDRALAYCHCKECDMRFFSPALTGSETFYESLQSFPWYYLEEKPEFDCAARWISETDRVLEIGCGRGAFASRILAEDYTGLEFSSKAAQEAVEKGLHVRAESVEVHAKLHKAQYDTVCAFQVLEHVGSPSSMLNSCIQLLKPGGRLIVSVPSVDSFIGVLCNSALDLPPHHVTRWSDRTMKYIARLCGVELLELDHESLMDLHKVAYLQTVFTRAVNRWLGRPDQLIDVSVMGRMINIAGRQFAKVFAKGMDDERLLPRGHSVTAVYQKPESGPREPLNAEL